MIRSMTQDDIAVVHQIESAVQSHPWSKKQFLEAFKSYCVTVLVHDGEVCGFCILQPVLDEANLLLMAVHPQAQGRGFGYKLLIESIDLLSNQPVQVFLEVRRSNIAAIALYEKSGFHQIDVRKNYYPQGHGQREDAIIMVKPCTDDFSALFS